MAKGITVDLAVRMASYEASINKAIADLNRFQDEAKNSSKSITTSIDGIGESLGSTLSRFVGIGAAIAAFSSMKSFVSDTINAADKLGDLSIVLGISVENLSGLGLAATQAGTNIDSVARAINKMYITSTENPAAFASIGLTAKDGLGQLKQLADKFASMESVTDRARIANKAYGRGWQEIAPLLAGGGAAIDEAIAKAKAIGVVTTQEAANMKKFNEHMDELHLKWGRFAIDIANVALPAVTSFFGAMEKGIDRLKNKWSLVKAVKDLLTEQFGESKEGGKSGAIAVATPAPPPEAGKKKTTRKDQAFIEGYDDEKANNARLLADAQSAQKDREALSASGAKTEQLLYDNRLTSIDDFYEKKRARESNALTNLRLSIEEEIRLNQKSLKGGKLDTLAEQEAVLIKEKILKNKLKNLDIAEKDKMEELFFASKKDTQEYKDSVDKLSASLLTLKGHAGEAARITSTIDNRSLRESAIASGDNATLKLLNDVRELNVARADANTIELEATNIQTNLNNIEARLTLQQKAGTITELGLIQEIDTARGNSVVALEKLVAEYEALAKASGDPKLLRDADTLKLKLEELKASSHQLADKFNTLFQNASSNAFADFIGGTKSAKDAFKSFANDVVQQINRIAAQQLSQSLFGGGSSGGGGIGGIISGFLGGSKGGGGFSSLFGGGGGGGVPDFGTGQLVMDSYVPLAVGTNYVPRDMIAKIHEGEAVVPKKYNVQGYGSVQPSRSMSVVNNFTLMQQTDNRSQSQIAAAAARGISISARRNG